MRAQVFPATNNVRSKSKIGPSNIELDTVGMELDKLSHVKKDFECNIIK